METLKNSYDSIGRPRTVLAGLSGGADSVALLLSLCDLRKECELEIFAVHVNHGLREEAIQDEAFCQGLCEKLRVPFIAEKAQVCRTGSLEAAARTARYAAFEKAMQASAADVLALGHHLDDQAETVLMHLMYGTGPSGLGGMREKNSHVWRPFLQLRRKQLQAYVTAKGYDWREDESNSDIAFTRNRIRAKVLPAMEECTASTVNAIGRASAILQTESDFLQLLADDWLSKYAAGGAYSFLLLQPLKNEHLAMKRRILRRYCEKLQISIDYAQTERLCNLLDREAGSTENLSNGWHAFRSKTRLHFISGDTPAVHSLGDLFVGDTVPNATEGYQQQLPVCQLHGLVLRTRKTGDYIQPFGMQGTKPLKEYMIDRGIDQPFRDGWPLVCRDHEVLWVIGVGASEKLRVMPNDTEMKQLYYSGRLPDSI